MPLTADTSEPLLITGTQGVTDVTFRQLRQLTQAIGKGVVNPSDMAVTAPGGMDVQVAAGYAWVPGSTLTGPTGQHKYGVPLTAAKTLGSVTAPLGSTRRDSVVLRVYDEGDAPGAGLIAGRVEYRVNPVESVTPEALPANAMLLAYVDVTVGAAAITTGMILDRRPLSSRGTSGVYNVRADAFGAVGDGVADDLPAFQAAVTAAGAAGGGTVLVPEGTYRLDGILNMASNVTLRGVGIGSVLAIDDNGLAANNLIYLNGVSGCTIRDLRVTQTGVASRSGLYGNIRGNSATDCSVLNCTIDTSPSTGIHLIACTGWIIDGNLVRDCKADGVHISRACKRIRVTRNEIRACEDDGVGVISYWSTANPYANCEDVVIAGNNIRDLVLGRGVAVYGGRSIIVEGNTITSVDAAGVIVGVNAGDVDGTSTHYTVQAIIRGNTIKDTGDGVGAGTTSGIYLSNCRQVSAEGNIIDEPGAAGDGITVAGACIDIAMIGNHISRAPSRGIYVDQTQQTAARLLSELFTDLGDTAPAAAGMAEILIEGNTIRTTGQDAIRVKGENTLRAKGAIISGNRLTPTAAANIDAVELSFVDSSVVTGNRGTAHNVGVRAATCDNLAITSNVLIGGSASQIALTSVSDSLISGNVCNDGASFGIFEDAGSSANNITGNVLRNNTGGGVSKAGSGGANTNNTTT